MNVKPLDYRKPNAMETPWKHVCGVQLRGQCQGNSQHAGSFCFRLLMSTLIFYSFVWCFFFFRQSFAVQLRLASNLQALGPWVHTITPGQMHWDPGCAPPLQGRCAGTLDVHDLPWDPGCTPPLQGRCAGILGAHHHSRADVLGLANILRL